MIVRKELEKVLANKGLTKAGFARLLGVTPQYIGQVMAGKRPLHKHTIEQIEGVLHLRPGTLTTSGGTSSGQGTASALNLMEGVEVAYLEICMEAVAEARHMLRRQRIDKALTKARGKDDTRFFDLAPEYAIVECLREFDRECAIFTEEGTTDDCRQFANRLAFFIDPFDRSIPFSDALQSMRSKGDYIADAIDHPDWPLHGLDAPFASITCLRESQVVFNVMADYVSGEVYVACKAMLKHGSIDRFHNPETVA
jgi:transcriptional regulator with XRE-family HTH domain